MSCRAADELGRCDVLEGLRRNTILKGSSLNRWNLSTKSYAASTDLLSRALRCSEGSACRQTTPLCRVLWVQTENLRRGVNRFVAQSGGQRVLCVSAEVDQTERAAACQTPKQSELTSYNKYLQISTLCSNFVCSDFSSQPLFGTSARRTEHQVAPRSVLAARSG
jgi:hypothetical protein